MNTYRLPDEVRAVLTDDIAAHIERYRATGVPDSHWAALEHVVKPLVAATQPSSVTDANVTLGNAAHFLRWVEPRAGTLDADVVFTKHWVERYGRENPRELTAGTAAAQLGRLRRLVRVTRGEAPCTRRAPRDAGPQPYDAAERSLLKDASTANPHLRAVLQATDAGSVHRMATPGGWDDARSAAARSGVTLRLDRLRATYVHDALQRRLPAAQILRQAGLTRADVDNVMAHLPRPDAMTCASLLRG